MSHALLSLACHAYIIAALVYFAHLVRQWSPLVVVGRVLVGAGLGLHAAALAGQLSAQGGRPIGLAQGLSMVTFLLLAIFMVVDLRYRRPVLGAFLTPLAVAVLLPGVVLMPEGGAPLPAHVARPLLPVHVSIALLGLAAFAVAAGVAVLYLVMERQVKAKHFGLLFTRLPSLEFLDTLNARLVVAGFIALSITLVTGVFFVSGSSDVFWAWEPKMVATALAWAVFAVLLNARFFAGWQGKRVAFLTMAGFGLVVVSFLSAFSPSHLTSVGVP
jgi:ABC-type uncharacterized transport system permease subunit